MGRNIQTTISWRVPNRQPKHEIVLQHLFTEHRELFVLQRLINGLSGSVVYLVQAIRLNGDGELPLVVKIDRKSLIVRERNAFKEHAEQRLGNIARLVRSYIPDVSTELAGILYELVGANDFAIQSLHKFLGDASEADIDYVLKQRLFTSMSGWWRGQTIRHHCQLGREYDSLLPLNLILLYRHVEPNTTMPLLTPDEGFYTSWRQEETVRLTGFYVERTEPKTKGLTLNNEQHSFRIRVEGVPNWDQYEANDLIEPMVGIIAATRSSLFREKMQAIFGEDPHSLQTEMPLPLPDPIEHLPAKAEEMRSLFFSSIHGDLNLNNVQIEKVGNIPSLIDFGKTQKGHSVRDLLHLEMAIVRKFIGPNVAYTGQAKAIFEFYERLHAYWFFPNQVVAPAELKRPFNIIKILRETSKVHLYAPSDAWREYYDGLYFYLLGVLQHSAKHHELTIAYWGAAAILQLLNDPSTETELKQKYCHPSQEAATPLTEKSAQGPATSRPSPPPATDLLSRYEYGLYHLRREVEQSGMDRSEFHQYESELQELITRSRELDNPDALRQERSDIIIKLNAFAEHHFGEPFSRFYRRQ